MKTENQSIAMLVPSPTEEIKTLIGDTNADETSDLSENSDVEDESDGREIFTSSLLIESSSPKVTPIVTVTPDSLTSMQSLISIDTSNPTIITEAKNNMILIDDDGFKKPEPVQKLDFCLSGPVTQEQSLGELTLNIEKPSIEEEEFDSMVSPTQVRDHKKSIDEQFDLLFDDNNNTNSSIADEIFMTPERIAVVKAQV